jgi:tRNA (guanine-N7-)-methyltransferase
MPENNPPAEKFYGRRKGKKLRPTRAGLIETLLPEISIQPEALPDFSKWAEVWLEVGFGGGERLAAQAAEHPDVLMLGAEPFINGVGKLLSQIEAEKLKNIRILPNDVRPLLDALPDASIGRVFVLFADPWPKARHAERRFIGPANLGRLARVMKPGAELRLASDHPILIPWLLEQMQKRQDFKWLVEGAQDWTERPADWPPTRYEQKALHGVPVFFRYQRI